MTFVVKVESLPKRFGEASAVTLTTHKASAFSGPARRPVSLLVTPALGSVTVADYVPAVNGHPDWQPTAPARGRSIKPFTTRCHWRHRTHSLLGLTF